MEKICIDCGKRFSPPCNRPVRCLKCQEKYRKKYCEEWNIQNWKTITTNSHQSKFYQYAKFVETLSDDDIRALITKYTNELKYAKTYDERQEMQTYIKILETEYSSRDEERVTRVIESWESGNDE